MSARPALKFKPKRGNAFHTSRKVSENSELFKKLNPDTQFQWERISSFVQPRRSLRRSEAEPTTSSRYSSFRGRERSLNPGRLRRAARHSPKNCVSPIGFRRPSAFGSDWRRVKSPSRLPSPHCVPCQGSAQVCKSVSKPEDLQIRHTQTPVERTLDADMSLDHRPSAYPMGA